MIGINEYDNNRNKIFAFINRNNAYYESTIFRSLLKHNRWNVSWYVLCFIGTHVMNLKLIDRIITELEAVDHEIETGTRWSQSVKLNKVLQYLREVRIDYTPLEEDPNENQHLL